VQVSIEPFSISSARQLLVELESDIGISISCSFEKCIEGDQLRFCAPARKAESACPSLSCTNYQGGPRVWPRLHFVKKSVISSTVHAVVSSFMQIQEIHRRRSIAPLIVHLPTPSQHARPHRLCLLSCIIAHGIRGAEMGCLSEHSSRCLLLRYESTFHLLSLTEFNRCTCWRTFE
jgi:hypothetical protein